MCTDAPLAYGWHYSWYTHHFMYIETSTISQRIYQNETWRTGTCRMRRDETTKRKTSKMTRYLKRKNWKKKNGPNMKTWNHDGIYIFAPMQPFLNIFGHKTIAHLIVMVQLAFISKIFNWLLSHWIVPMVSFAPISMWNRSVSNQNVTHSNGLFHQR